MEKQNNEGVSSESELSVLVCGVRSTKDGVTISQDSEYFELFQFDHVSQHGTKPDFLDPLFNCLDIGSVVRDNSRIYFIGLAFRANYAIPDSLCSESTTGENVDCLQGVAWVDLDDKHNPTKWFFGPPPPLYGLVIDSTVLDGIVYFLSSGCLQDIYEYIPDSDTWFESNAIPPMELARCQVGGKMIPDPNNHRILLHLVRGELPSPGLYAWYPHQHHAPGCDIWSCIEPNMDPCIWKKKFALAEGRLFYYFRGTEGLFRVYDLSARTWATVEWTRHYPFFLTQRVKACGIFCSGHHQICLAVSELVLPPKGLGSRITFFVFQFEPSPEGTPEDPIIIMRYLTTKTVFIEGIVKALEFIPLQA